MHKEWGNVGRDRGNIPGIRFCKVGIYCIRYGWHGCRTTSERDAFPKTCVAAYIKTPLRHVIQQSTPQRIRSACRPCEQYPPRMRTCPPSLLTELLRRRARSWIQLGATFTWAAASFTISNSSHAILSTFTSFKACGLDS